MWILICLSLNIETDSTRDTLTTATAAGVDGHVWKHGGGGRGIKGQLHINKKSKQ